MAMKAKAMAPKTSGPTKMNFSQAFWEEAREMIAGVAAERAIQILPKEVVEKIASVLPERLLFDNDARLRWASVIGLAFAGLGLESTWRHATENFLVQGAEEVGKISAKLDADKPEESRKLIHDAIEKKRSLLDPLKPKKEQGDAAQKKALPDYFTAKAAIKDRNVQDVLTEIEAALPRDKMDLLLRKAGYRIQTTPEELASIAHSSTPADGHAYGVLRLLGLMEGGRGEGGVKAKVQAFAESLFDDVKSEDFPETVSKNLKEATEKADKRLESLKKRI